MIARYEKTTFIGDSNTSNSNRRVSQKNTVLIPGINWD
jgi:hypothetical protein